MLLKDFLDFCCDDFIICNENHEFLCSSVNRFLPEDCEMFLDCYIKYVSSTFFAFDYNDGYINCIQISIYE